MEVIDVSTLTPRKIGNYTSCPKIEYNSQSAYDAATKRLFTAANHAASFAIINVAEPSQPTLTGLLQDPNRSSQNETFSGATGCAFDLLRNLTFVASEGSLVFAVIDVADSSMPRVVGQVRHPVLAGEAVAYDSVRQRAFVVCRKTSALVVVDVQV
jgi:hypothetical protein